MHPSDHNGHVPSQPAAYIGEMKGGAHDGATIVDPSQCALALFVLPDGQMHVQSRLSMAQQADVLEQIAAKARARA